MSFIFKFPLLSLLDLFIKNKAIKIIVFIFNQNIKVIFEKLSKRTRIALIMSLLKAILTYFKLNTNAVMWSIFKTSLPHLRKKNFT